MLLNDTPSVKLFEFATFPKGTAFGSPGKLIFSIRCPLGKTSPGRGEDGEARKGNNCLRSRRKGWQSDVPCY